MSVRNLGIDLLKKMSGSSCGTSENWKLGWQGKEWKNKAMPQIFSFYFTSRLCNGCVSIGGVFFDLRISAILHF